MGFCAIGGSKYVHWAACFLLHHFCRYISVHHPLDYNLAMNDPRAIRRRLLSYLLPVVVASVLFNLPKFFETKAEIVQILLPDNTTDWTVRLNVTEMRVSCALHA